MSKSVRNIRQGYTSPKGSAAGGPYTDPAVVVVSTNGCTLTSLYVALNPTLATGNYYVQVYDGVYRSDQDADDVTQTNFMLELQGGKVSPGCLWSWEPPVEEEIVADDCGVERIIKRCYPFERGIIIRVINEAGDTVEGLDVCRVTARYALNQPGYC